MLPFFPAGAILLLLAALIFAGAKFRSHNVIPIEENRVSASEQLDQALSEERIALNHLVLVVREELRLPIKDQLRTLRQSSRFDDIYMRAVLGSFARGVQASGIPSLSAGQTYLSLSGAFHPRSVAGLQPEDGLKLISSTNADNGHSCEFAIRLITAAAQRCATPEKHLSDRFAAVLMSVYKTALLNGNLAAADRERLEEAQKLRLSQLAADALTLY